jgi:hypothetical protein
MRSKHFLGLCLVGGFAAMALAATGCGGDSTTSTTSTGSGGSGTGGGAATTTTGTNTTSSTTTTTGSNTTSAGTGGATGNHSFDTALPIDINPSANTTGALVDANTTTDYYKFTGTKGQRITAVVIAQGLSTDANHDPNDITFIDSVVTIYDAAKKQIAQNDDAWPRTSTDSQAFTVLPADGDYYLTVNNFCTAFSSISGACTNAGGVTTLDYELFIAEVDKLNVPDVNEGAEPNDDTSKSVKATYALPTGGMAGGYGISIIEGSFQTGTDVDVYALNIPADTKFDANQRAHAEFWVQPISPENGTGSTTNAKVWVVDSSDLTKHVAEVDQINYGDGDNPTNGPIDMSVPIVAGHSYYLFVQHGVESSKPESDFYFMKHFIGSYYYGQLEKTPDLNNTAVTAEALTTPAMVTAGNYFVDGDLSTPIDVDYYVVDVAAGATTASLFCDAQRQGSGLRNAKFSLLKTDGSALGSGNVLSEVPNKDAYLSGTTAVAIPAGTSKVLLKVEAGSQDPNVVGNFYHCSISVAAPAP